MWVLFEERLQLCAQIQGAVHKSGAEEWKDESLNGTEAEQGPYVMD